MSIQNDILSYEITGFYNNLPISKNVTCYLVIFCCIMSNINKNRANTSILKIVLRTKVLPKIFNINLYTRDHI